MSEYAALLEYVRADDHRAALQWLHDHPTKNQTDAAEHAGVKYRTLCKWIERARKRRAAADPTAHAPKAPPGYKLRGVSSLLDASGAVKQQWVKTAPDNESTVRTIEALREELAELDIPRLEPSSAPQHTMDDLCAVYPMGDPHFGMRSWEHETGVNFDLPTAKRDLLAAHQALCEMAPPASRAIVCSLGDFFHADNSSAKTPKSGHSLDVDSRHELVARVGFYAFRTCVQLALQKHAQVDVIMTRGNHDPESSLLMKLIIEAMFENEPRCTVHTRSDFYDYLQHGRCLFGFHHGDGAKASALGEVMAADRPKLWGDTDHRHWYTGHVHHETFKELRGCSVETVNTLAARDAWHHHAGYRSKRRALVDIWHGTDGHVSRQRWAVGS